MSKPKLPAAGESLPPLTIESVSAKAMADLAVILRDPNPIHLDRQAVRTAGLGERRINQGPANMAYVMNMLAEALPDAELKSMSIAFTANVCEDDHVSVHADVTEITEDEAGTIIDCAFQLDVRDSRPALKGTARLIQQVSANRSKKEEQG